MALESEGSTLNLQIPVRILAKYFELQFYKKGHNFYNMRPLLYCKAMWSHVQYTLVLPMCCMNPNPNPNPNQKTLKLASLQSECTLTK